MVVQNFRNIDRVSVKKLDAANFKTSNNFVTHSAQYIQITPLLFHWMKLLWMVFSQLMKKYFQINYTMLLNADYG